MWTTLYLSLQAYLNFLRLKFSHYWQHCTRDTRIHRQKLFDLVFYYFIFGTIEEINFVTSYKTLKVWIVLFCNLIWFCECRILLMNTTFITIVKNMKIDSYFIVCFICVMGVLRKFEEYVRKFLTQEVYVQSTKLMTLT